MELHFTTNSKKIGRALEKGDQRMLVRLYDQDSAEHLMDCLNMLLSAKNLHEVMSFKQFRPHELSDRSLSLSLNGRKRMTIRTLDQDGRKTKELDYNSPYGLILEVTEHYGD